MSQPDVVTIFTDGASRGNPGPAAYAYVIKRDGAEDVEEKSRLPDTTNNVAEYTALVRALEHAQRLGARRLNICTDSELMVKQVQGSYRVKNEGLRPLYEKALDLLDRFDSFTIRHVPRSQNAHADRLCNEALDEGRKTMVPGAQPARAKPSPAALQERVREEALACLKSVAAAWARGNPQDPKPDQVWDQLWSILEEAGVVRPR
jgi:ribonuclease HI